MDDFHGINLTGRGLRGAKGDVGDVNPQMPILVAEAEAARDEAEQAALAAAASAATAESAAGPTYPDTAAGLAATSDGEAFAVDNGDGTVTVYLNNAGVAVAQRTLLTTDYAASTAGAGAIGSDDGEGGSLWSSLAGFINYIRSSAGSSVIGFIQAGAGAIAWSLRDKQRERLSILDFCTPAQRADIRSGAGLLDVSGAWQAALNALTDNQQLDLVGGVHRLNSAVSTSGKSRIRIIGNGAQVVEGSPGTAALVTLASCPRVWVQDIHFVGSETYAYFAANNPTTRHRFLVITGAEAPRVENVTGQDKRGHIFLSGCSGAIVEKSHFVGFFQDVSLGAQADANQCTTVEFSGGANNKALFCYARHHGSNILWGADGEAPITVGCDGHDLHDNGIYVSSGSRARTFGNDFRAVAGSIVKTRGTGNVSFGNSGSEAVVGISMTGNGSVPDGYGANGSGNISALNSFDAISSDGISSLMQDGLYQRDGIVALNSIVNLTGTGGFGAVRSTMTQGGVIALNTADTLSCDYGILSAGTASIIQTGQVIFGNTVSNLSGAQQGVRVMYATSSLIGGNVGGNVSGLVQARSVTDSAFLSNVNPSGVYAVSASASNSNSGNIVLGQRGASSVDAATHPSTGNFPAATMPNPAVTTPTAINITTVVSGVGYISTGTASPADWKQITT